MRVYGPARKTTAETIRRHGELADPDGDADLVAQAWTSAGFDDAMTARWLAVRCFDPQAARALADLEVRPEQVAVRTRDGGGDYVDTVAYKVANGDLTARQGYARSLSSR